MYYFPKKENSLGRVKTLKFSWDRISGIHCLLLPQHSEIFLGLYFSYSSFTTRPRITLAKELHVILRTPDPLRHISRSSSSFTKKLFLFQKFMKIGHSVCHHDKYGYCKFNYHCKKRTLQLNLKTSWWWSNLILQE